MYRRSWIAAVLTVLVATSGCTGFATGSDNLAFAAEPAVTDEATASEANYEFNGTANQTVTQEVSAAGQSREVEVTNRISTYERAVEVPTLGEAKLGVLAVVSSPAVEILGQTFNPIADYDNARLVRLFAGSYEGLEVTERVDQRELAVLGTETTVSKFAATASFEGQEVDVYVHATKVRDGGDFVAVMAIYPQRLDDEPAVVSMIEAVRHPA